MRCIKLTLFYLHVVRQEQLYLICLKTILVKNINSIKKFIARRGCPEKIVPDNGKVFTSQENQSFYAEQGITWKFNLDGAPW